MSVKLGTVVSDAQEIIGEVAGPGVQTFSEDKMRNDAIRGFNLMFKKFDWDQYLQWFRLQLSGTNGRFLDSAPLANVLDFEDIRGVFRDGDGRELSIKPKKLNPYAFAPSGSTAQLWYGLPATDTNYAGQKIQFLPFSCVGFINVSAKVYPKTDYSFDNDTVLYLDRDLLAYAAAFQALIGDGLNPDAAAVVQGLMENKYKAIMNALSGHITAVRTTHGVVTDWTQVP